MTIMSLNLPADFVDDLHDLQNELRIDHPLFTEIDSSKEKLIYFYNPVESLLQEGFTCGLVCLLQAKRFIQPNSEPWTLPRILAEARRMRLSNQGEMFSATGVERLAREVLGLNASTWTCMNTNRKRIIERLVLDRAAILIPYDAGDNSEPALLNGHRAHWCICTGFGFRVKLNELSNWMPDKLEEWVDKIFINLKSVDLRIQDLFRLINRSTELNLFCKQGHSNQLKVFDFDDLMLSNKNLLSVRNSTTTAKFLIPEEGIAQSLCNKFVVITGWFATV